MKIILIAILLACTLTPIPVKAATESTPQSPYTILIPKTIDLSTDLKKEFTIQVKGHLNVEDTLTISASPTIQMVNVSDSTKVSEASVEFPAHTYKGNMLSDTYLQEKGTITFNEQRAGSYKGTLQFEFDYFKKENILTNGLYYAFDRFTNRSITSIEFVDYVPTDFSTFTTFKDVSATQDQSVMAWIDQGKLLIGGKGGVTAHENSSFLFVAFSNVATIRLNKNFDLSHTTNISNMFDALQKLETIEGMEDLDTSKITKADECFEDCIKLKTITNLDKLKFPALTSANKMFRNCPYLTGSFDFGDTLLTSDTAIEIVTDTSIKDGATFLISANDPATRQTILSTRTPPTSPSSGVYKKMNENTIQLNTSSLTLPVGATQCNIQINIEDAQWLQNTQLSWSSSNPSVVQCNSNDPLNNRSILALKPGQSTLTFSLTDADGTTWSQSCLVTVQ